MTMQMRRAFLDDILSHPNSDTARFIYADWLEEQDDPTAKLWRMPLTEARLDTLAEQQQSLLPLVRDHWLNVGLATEPVSRDKAWAAVRDAYCVAGLPLPTVQIWLASPFAGAVGAAMLSALPQNDQVWDQVGYQVWNQVRNQVGNQVWNQVGNQVRNQVWDQVHRAGYGQHDAHWLAFYAVMKLCGVKAAARLTPLMVLAHHCGWWWPFSGGVILTERPELLEMSNGKLVRIRYSDGFEAGPGVKKGTP